MSEWIKKLAAKYAEVNMNESKILIPEEIPTAERNAYMGAAAAAHKAGKTHFTFNGKKHPVTMKKDTATAIADQKESKKPMGEEEEVVMNPKKDKKEKKDANAEAEMAAEARVDEISKDLAGRYIKKAQISTADAGRDTMDDRPHIRKRGINKIVNRRMGTADAVRKLTGKARVPATESVEESVELTRNEKAPVYSKILENRAAHYKKATKPQEWDDAEKGNKGAQDMRADNAVDDTDKVSNYDKLGHDDASKANKAGPNAKPRSNDNKAGDKKIINPVAGAVTKE